MRDDRVSLTRAAREAQVSPRMAIRLAGSALRKGRNGRYVAAAHDRLLRVLVIPTEDGTREIALRDSREASKVARYFHALRQYLHGRDVTALDQFRRTRIRLAVGRTVSLLVDRDALHRLAHAGLLAFESIYARTA